MKRMLLAACATLCACDSPSRPAPELGRGLPANYAEGTQEFGRRAKARFPVGSSEAALRRELERQGFESQPTHDGVHSATFYRREFSFVTIWSVRWRAQDGRITDLWGVYGAQAP